MRGVSNTTIFIILLTVTSIIVFKRITAHETPIEPKPKHRSPDIKSSATMPLVDSTTMNPQDKNELWSNKLVGKTLHDTDSNETLFSKKDLPEETRIIKPGTMVTKDFRENRLNVHVDEEGKVSHVVHG